MAEVDLRFQGKSVPYNRHSAGILSQYVPTPKDILILGMAIVAKFSQHFGGIRMTSPHIKRLRLGKAISMQQTSKKAMQSRDSSIANERQYILPGRMTEAEMKTRQKRTET